jgi:hypothetical protein
MRKFEHVQCKVQEIGHAFTAACQAIFEDGQTLQYINALVMEATRWWPFAPMDFLTRLLRILNPIVSASPRVYLLSPVWGDFSPHSPGPGLLVYGLQTGLA